MRPLFVLLRIVVVGVLWSILFIEGIRVILLTNWHFDIFRATHWSHAWNLWLSGWVIDEPKEWAFVLIILTAVPVWATVWAALSIVKWEAVLQYLYKLPQKILKKVVAEPIKEISSAKAVKKVVKKKSYKEVRPRNMRAPMEDSGSTFSAERRAQLSGVPYKPQPVMAKPAVKAAEPKEFSHSLFELDSGDEAVDFDLFEEKPEVINSDDLMPVTTDDSEKSRDTEPKGNAQKRKQKDGARNDNRGAGGDNRSKNYHTNSTFEVLKQKGYEIISGVTLKDVAVDFVGVSKGVICLCLNDKETGDWLADEERFNDEEPLWFSESSHRISPVRKGLIAKEALVEKLADKDWHFEVKVFVIEQIGNIINAEDMFDIWKDLEVNVTRIDRGTPKEIPLFVKKLEDAEGSADKGVMDKLRKLLRGNG
ncbi:MAG: hypothetical protein IJ184_07065 [Alphaproteobacteria bacterium]|nr:hypothetical protein [Alphaproteobacteria bacterium]